MAVFCLPAFLNCGGEDRYEIREIYNKKGILIPTHGVVGTRLLRRVYFEIQNAHLISFLMWKIKSISSYYCTIGQNKGQALKDKKPGRKKLCLLKVFWRGLKVIHSLN